MCNKMEGYNLSNIPTELLLNIMDELDLNSLMSLCETNADNKLICQQKGDKYWKNIFDNIFNEIEIPLQNYIKFNKLTTTIFPPTTYNFIQEYNEDNHTSFNSWYDVVYNINTELQYAIKIWDNALTDINSINGIIDGLYILNPDQIFNTRDSYVFYIFYIMTVREIMRFDLYLFKYFFRIIYTYDSMDIVSLSKNIFQNIAYYSKLYMYTSLDKYISVEQYNDEDFADIIDAAISSIDNNKTILYYIYNKLERYNERLLNIIFKECCKYKYYPLIVDMIEFSKTYINIIFDSGISDDVLKDIIKILRENNIVPDDINVDYVMQRGSVYELDVLLDMGYTLTVYDLNEAISYKRIDIFKYILDKGILPDKESLHLAMYKDVANKNIIDALLGYKIYFNVSTLNNAISLDNTYVIKYLLDSGVIPNKESLQEALNNYNKYTLDLLLNYGISLEINNLNDAIRNGKNNSIIYILEHGIKPDDESFYLFFNNRTLTSNNNIIQLMLKDVSSLLSSDINIILSHSDINLYEYIVSNNIAIDNDVSLDPNLVYKSTVRLGNVKYLQYALDNQLISIEDGIYQSIINNDVPTLDYILRISDNPDYNNIINLAITNNSIKVVSYILGNGLSTLNLKPIIIKLLMDNINKKNSELLNLIRKYDDISMEDKNNLLINAYDKGYYQNIVILLNMGADVYSIPNIVDTYIQYTGNDNHTKDDIIRFVKSPDFSKVYLTLRLREAINNNNINIVSDVIRQGLYPTNELVQLAKDLGYTRLANFMKYYVK
ncbi:Ankyrin-repeat protein [Orpheovirus IHUMI-LCC2]|uniref:Ankyrin-repeat protein n=1 Tax=Orpheovirus IHUMI-LCC2 TaxID=2023057 RepID=A0A2I2L4U9_9VIRU|nr:Ankyrin-repeat protein [Orpheovirus IHUMI-LCC2]SNW62547.1 Ankyrin-repeat protein [Orpheovirus IHUMI-LCC2]